MMNIQINKEELYKLYMEKVDEICQKCDWVTDFGPKEIIYLISKIIEDNFDVIIK